MDSTQLHARAFASMGRVDELDARVSALEALASSVPLRRHTLFLPTHAHTHTHAAAQTHDDTGGQWDVDWKSVDVEKLKVTSDHDSEADDDGVVRVRDSARASGMRGCVLVRVRVCESTSASASDGPGARASSGHDSAETAAVGAAGQTAAAPAMSEAARHGDAYYRLPLAVRARILDTLTDRLCKCVILENLCPKPHAHGDAHGRARPYAHIGTHKYVCVIVQYAHKLDMRAIETLLGASAGVRLADAGAELTGFSFNAITPVGARTHIPMIVPTAIAHLPHPQHIWLGGGAVDVKLRVFVSELMRYARETTSFDAAVAEVTVPREDDDREGDA